MAPIPAGRGQQLGDALGGMIGDASEDIGEPGARIDSVELARLDQRVDGCRPHPAGIGATEGPVAPADGDAAHGALGGVVGHADAAVVEEARHGHPSLQAVIHRFGQGVLGREFSALLAQPFFEIIDERL